QLFGIENVTGTAFGDGLTGDGDSNFFSGNGGGDLMQGLGGNDTLFGGTGGDVMYGGTGNDIFRFQNQTGADVIKDFDQLGNDILQFQGFGAGFDFADFALTVVGGNDVLVEATGWTGTVLLENAAGLVDASDFTFI
ncbi:MAG: calcium-binding protein, partial [Rhizobiaceae bacterium]